MHQPIQTNKVVHGITLDDTDVIITRFLEYIDGEWLGENQNLLNFSNVRFDLGHDTLTFTTHCDRIDLIEFVKKLSYKFPTIFMMYDYYTDVDNENDLIEGRYYLLAGKITTDNTELHIEHEV